MSASGILGNAVNLDMQASRPLVYINGGAAYNAYCLQIEDSTGIVPPKAMIQVMGEAQDTLGNITLNATGKGWPFGCRIKIELDSQNIFYGNLAKRRDQGQKNSVMLEAWGDIWLLARIPVRGCFCWDIVDGCVKFIDRLALQVNPKGYNNCFMANWQDAVIPVFVNPAEQGAAWDNGFYDSIAEQGKVCAWTPLKFISYLQAAANADSTTPGVNSTYRTLKTSKRLKWEQSSVSFTKDTEMTLKMPDHVFQGQNMLRCLQECLDMAGDWGVRTNCSGDDGKSAIEFFAASKQFATSPMTLSLQRGGPVDDPATIFDFELDEDCTNTSEAVLGQGASIRIEGQFANAGGILPEGGDAAPNDWKRSWVLDEEIAFCRIIDGWDTHPQGTHVDGAYPGPSHPPQYAKYPSKIPDTTGGETWMSVPWILADGLAGRLLTYPNTPEAVALARKLLPRVWRTFEVNGAVARANGTLSGLSGEFSNTNDYPMLTNPRPVDPEQLAYYLDTALRKTRQLFPIRIQVDDGIGYHEVSAQAGVKVDKEGFVNVDGLTDEHGNEGDRIYSGSLMVSPQTCTLRPMKANLTVHMDQRLTEEVRQSFGEMDGLLATDLGGPLQLYIDSPEGYRLDEQVNSDPAAVTSFVGANATVPLNRILRNDGSTLSSATYRLEDHCHRRGRQAALVKRISNWSVVGIRPDIRAGSWIKSINCVGQPGDAPYVIESWLPTVLLDFVQQRTVAGGLLSQSANARGKGLGSRQATPGEAPVAGGQAGAVGAGGMTLAQGMLAGEFGAQQEAMGKGAKQVGGTFKEAFEGTQRSMAEPFKKAMGGTKGEGMFDARASDKRGEANTAKARMSEATRDKASVEKFSAAKPATFGKFNEPQAPARPQPQPAMQNQPAVPVPQPQKEKNADVLKTLNKPEIAPQRKPVMPEEE
jgi:hypothetical protein